MGRSFVWREEEDLDKMKADSDEKLDETYSHEKVSYSVHYVIVPP
jgi:hypothetical protein